MSGRVVAMLVAVVAVAPLLAAHPAAAVDPPIDRYVEALLGLTPGFASPASPLVNGGFEACANRDVAFLSSGPEPLVGRSACPGWMLRKGHPFTPNRLPLSRSEGHARLDNHVGVLSVTYNGGDGVVVLEQTMGVRTAATFADVDFVRFTLRSDWPARIGFRVTVPDDNGNDMFMPAVGSPIALAGGEGWRSFTLGFPADGGPLRAATLEIHSETRSGAVIDFDEVVLTGTRVAPRG